jgi:hypothetical protein
METRALWMYYKAAVIVPFFTSCFFLLVVWVADTSMMETMLKVTLFSGIMSLLAAGIFLNRFKNISIHFVRCLLSFFLLPVLFCTYIIYKEVDWRALKYSNGNMVDSAVLFVIFFIHLIGLAISFVDLRQSIIKTIEEENEAQHELRTIYDDQLPYV